MLEHQPHGLDVVARVAPIPLGVQVSESQLGGLPKGDLGRTVADLAGDELKSAPGALVVDKHPRAGVQAVALAIVDGDPVAVDLGHSIWASGMEGCGFGLGDLVDLAEHFAGTCLVETDIRVDEADGVEHAGYTQGRRLTGQDRLAEGCLDK